MALFFNLRGTSMNAVVALGATLLLAACAANPKSAWNVDPAVAAVEPGAEVLHMKAPGLPETGTLRARYLDNYQEEEYVLYRGENGAQAEAITIEASQYGYGAQPGDRHVLEFRKITRDTVDLWNMTKTADPMFGQAIPYDGKLPYYLLPFERRDTGQSCFGFHSEFNSDPRDPDGGLYDNQLFGYYCAPKGTALAPADMIAVVNGVEIAGITKPAGPALDLHAFDQLTNDAQLTAAVQQGMPKGETGSAAFPLDVARIYDDNGGGESVP